MHQAFLKVVCSSFHIINTQIVEIITYISVCLCRCLLELCGYQLQLLGEYLLELIELVDEPLTLLVSAIEHAFDRIRQFFTYSFQPSSSDETPDVQYPDDDPGPHHPGPPTLTLPLPDRQLHIPADRQLDRQLHIPQRQLDRELQVPEREMPMPPTRGPPNKLPSSSLPTLVPVRLRSSESGLDQVVDEALDLSTRYTSHSTPQRADTHAQNTHSQATDTLDWNPQLGGTPAAHSSAACLWPPVTKTTATHVQSARLSSALRHSDQRAVRMSSDSCLETLFYSHQPKKQQHHSTTPLCREQPPLCEAPVALWSQEQTFNRYQQYAPVDYEQCGQYEGGVAPGSDEQRSLPVQSVATVLSESAGRVTRGGSPVGGLLQSLCVVNELVRAIQLAALTQCSSVVDNTDNSDIPGVQQLLISSLSAVFSVIQRQCQQQYWPSPHGQLPSYLIILISFIHIRLTI